MVTHRVFRSGIDSLYLSWVGDITEEVNQELASLKETSYNLDDLAVQAEAVIKLLIIVLRY